MESSVKRAWRRFVPEPQDSSQKRNSSNGAVKAVAGEASSEGLNSAEFCPGLAGELGTIWSEPLLRPLEDADLDAVSAMCSNDPVDWLTILNNEVVACRRCPRLVTYREEVARVKRRAYLSCDYWGKPVPGFGDPRARVLIMGLAPGAHGSNRTGRPFTGDASGNFMYPVLYETGFASQPTAIDRNDGMQLKDLYITAAVRCAPPDNKPLPQELAACSSFLDRELAGLTDVRVVVALGKIGFDAYLNYVKRQGTLASKKAFVFQHGAKYRMPDGKVLLASYHPSNQNTQTGKLTRKMFVEIFQEAEENCR